MLIWQKLIILIYCLFSLGVFLKSLYECAWKRNNYQDVLLLWAVGGFVWADGVVYGLFWFLTSLVCLVLGNWALFLLTVSVYWAVRTAGESFFFFNMQFQPLEKYPPKYFALYKHFHNESVYFAFQVTWHCVTAICIVLSIYLSTIFLANI